MRIINLNEIEVISKYKETKSLRITSKFFNVSIGPIKKILDKNKVNKNTSRKYSCNFNFFEKIDNEEKAYWLGFLYADGYVRKRKQNSELKLKIIDKEHLEKFNTNLKSNYPIKKENRSNCWILNISNRKIINDLIDKGCVQNKSLILNFPNENILPLNLINHFIRGYFDGDGHIGLTITEKYNRKEFNIIGTNNMINNIKIIFETNKINNMRIVEYKNKNIIYYLICNNYENILKIKKYLYDNSKIFLSRKKNIFDLIEQKYNLNKEHKCKKCNNDFTGHFNSKFCFKCKKG